MWPEVAAVQKAQKPVTDGLASFQLTPPGVFGVELFEHMAMFSRRNDPTEDTFEPEARLGLEISDAQKKILLPSAQDLTCRELLRDAGGDGATTKLAKRNLDALGYIKAYCGRAH